jgi:hypothetical protein
MFEEVSLLRQSVVLSCLYLYNYPHKPSKESIICADKRIRVCARQRGHPPGVQVSGAPPAPQPSRSARVRLRGAGPGLLGGWESGCSVLRGGGG